MSNGLQAPPISHLVTRVSEMVAHDMVVYTADSGRTILGWWRAVCCSVLTRTVTYEWVQFTPGARPAHATGILVHPVMKNCLRESAAMGRVPV